MEASRGGSECGIREMVSSGCIVGRLGFIDGVFSMNHRNDGYNINIGDINWNIIFDYVILSINNMNVLWNLFNVKKYILKNFLLFFYWIGYSSIFSMNISWYFYEVRWTMYILYKFWILFLIKILVLIVILISIP